MSYNTEELEVHSGLPMDDLTELRYQNVSGDELIHSRAMAASSMQTSERTVVGAATQGASQAAIPVKIPEPPRQFECSHCSSSFATQSALQ